MLSGLSIFETYDGPPLDATEFCLHPGNLHTRCDLLSSLYGRFKSISAHLPSFMPISDVMQETAFADERLTHFVAHVTKRAASDWKNSWRKVAACGRKVLFENHNQDWHETDAGLCWPAEFKPIVDAGHELCLDTGHILYASSFHVKDDSQWRDVAERNFEEFLKLPIRQVHAHTMEWNGTDHSLHGFNVGPWIKRIVSKHPDVVILVETGVPQYTVEDKLQALRTWLP